jgi:hypothetical protein
MFSLTFESFNASTTLRANAEKPMQHRSALDEAAELGLIHAALSFDLLAHRTRLDARGAEKCHEHAGRRYAEASSASGAHVRPLTFCD